MTAPYTPTSDEVRPLDLTDAEAEAYWDAIEGQRLATVTPNPADARQVEVVARIGAEMVRHVSLRRIEDDTDVQGLAEHYARAVLTALADLTGDSHG